MALIPFAEKKIIPAGVNDPKIIPIGVILHVDGGNAADLYGYFNGPSGGIESHGHIRKDGHLYQYRDTSWEADANYRANSFIGHDGRRYGFLSFETQGLAEGEWTPEQLDTIFKVLDWANAEHHIAMRVCPSPFEGGVGYHTMWGAPSDWTPYSKVCPGPDRIKQFKTVITPHLTEIGGGPNPSQEDDMPYQDWPQADKDALTKDVATATIKALLSSDLFPNKEEWLTVANALKGQKPQPSRPAKKAAAPKPTS